MLEILEMLDFARSVRSFVWVLEVVHVESNEVNLKMKLPEQDRRMLSQRE